LRVIDVEGIEGLESEPVRFVFEHLAPGSPELTPEALRQHSNNDYLLQPIRQVARGAALVSITNAVQRPGEVRVSAEHADGTARDWTFSIGEDGRIVAASAGRHVDGVDFWSGPPAEFSTAERRLLQQLFAAAYSSPDPEYLDRQLDTMTSLVVARRGTVVVGFALGGGTDIRTAALGDVKVALPGLTCVDPREQRSGIGQGMGMRATWLTLSTHGPREVAAPRFATPASFAMAMKGQGQVRWPPPDDLYAQYDHPTAAQIELAHQAALAYGNQGYDPATGACIGLGRPIGIPNVEPEVPDEYHRRFDGIDRQRGDSLLYLRWLVDPPDTWSAP
jgi:hypothetical protein